MDNQVLASWQRPILLVGDIGAGRTTFIRHLIKVSAKEILRDAVLLYVDLGAFATNQGAVSITKSREANRAISKIV